MGKKLTTWQAACIITGYGVGSGIMTLPYLITRAGTVSALAILLLAFFFSYCMHMMLAELTMGVGKGTQIVGIFQHYLFRGRFGKALTMGMFVLVTVASLSSIWLLMWQACGDSCLCGIAAPSRQDSLLRHCRRRGLFRLKVLGNRPPGHLIDIIIGIIVILAAGSMFHLDNAIYYAAGSFSSSWRFSAWP